MKLIDFAPRHEYVHRRGNSAEGGAGDRSEDGSALIDTVARLSDADLDYWEGETDGVQPPG
jgi:hypothetical protein